MIGGNIFSIMFGRTLDAHAPSDPASEINSNPSSFASRTSLAYRAPASDSSHHCLQGKECYAESLMFTIVACSLALVLGIYAGWKDYSARRQVLRGRQPAVEVLWEDTEE